MAATPDDVPSDCPEPAVRARLPLQALTHSLARSTITLLACGLTLLLCRVSGLPKQARPSLCPGPQAVRLATVASVPAGTTAWPCPGGAAPLESKDGVCVGGGLDCHHTFPL